jgi:hypothetical protein
MGIPTLLEDPIPVYYHGEMVWQGRADLIIGRCCVELKAIAKPPAAAGRQLHDYITEKNKIVMLQHGLASGFFGGQPDTRSIEHLLYWGLVINFNPSTGNVDTFVPPRGTASALESDTGTAESRLYLDTELLGCRVKLDGIRGMVDSITAGEHGEIIFQVQFSDGRRTPMRRSALEPILTDIDIPVSSDLQRKVTSNIYYAMFNIRY